MLSDTPGLHHVTGIVGDAGASAAFYGEALGLRLLRRTVNYEDILQYHLYFGDATGSPGSVFTVFPDPYADPGRTGKPGYEAVAFAVPPGSLDYWRTRLGDRNVTVEADDDRFDDELIAVSDPAGTRVELVESDAAGSRGSKGPGTTPEPPPIRSPNRPRSAASTASPRFRRTRTGPPASSTRSASSTRRSPATGFAIVRRATARPSSTCSPATPRTSARGRGRFTTPRFGSPTARRSWSGTSCSGTATTTCLG